jgi:DNA-binding transcriptional ArsR family regulator
MALDCKSAQMNRWEVKMSEALQEPRVIDPAKVEQAKAAIGADGEAVRRWAARFDLLSDPNRLRLLMAIHGAPNICVSDLAAATGMTDTAVSQALRLLRSQGWVTTRREGRMVLYALDDHTVHDMLHMLGAGHAAGAR